MSEIENKINYYRESINSLEGLKDDFDFIGVSDAVMSLLQELIDTCRWDLKEMIGDG